MILNEVFIDLLRTIAYFVSDERRRELLVFDSAQQLVAAIDMLALMAEHYQTSPEVNVSTVQRWRDICLLIFDQRSGFDPAEDSSGWKFQRRMIIGDVFAHLEAVAVAYPTVAWWASDNGGQ
jgi:hypothetical protein